MVLFLDFDGVLHPRSTLENLFVHIPRIEKVLRDFPFVQVVISSSWREVTPLLELQEKFSEDLRSRVIGTTPLVDIDYPPGPVGHREEEILIYMAQSEFIGKPWLALDDEAPFFTAGCPNLILCNSLTGLDDEVERQLRDRLICMFDDETLNLMRQHAQAKPQPMLYCQSDSGNILRYFYGGMGEWNTHPIQPERAESFVRLLDMGRLQLGKKIQTLDHLHEGLRLLQILDE